MEPATDKAGERNCFPYNCFHSLRHPQTAPIPTGCRTPFNGIFSFFVRVRQLRNRHARTSTRARNSAVAAAICLTRAGDSLMQPMRPPLWRAG